MNAPTTRLLDELVLLASRAPSPHNTQPWSPRVVPLDGDRVAVDVAVIPSRTLPAGDPSFRDVILSIGAWVESFTIGAAAAGFDTRVDPLPALSDLQQLPLRGPADPGRPVLRVEVLHTPPAAPTRFTPDDVRHRRVFRGRLAAHPQSWEDLTDVDLPPWLTLRRLDDRAMGYLSRLGIAFTGSRPSIARELLHWLRLDPRHPRYHLDGMTDAMLGIPRPLARLAAPATRWSGLRDPVLAVAGLAGRTAESLERARSLRPLELSLADTSDAAPMHLVLVANARLASGDDTALITAAMDSSIGIDEPDALQAGRVLQRLWLHAHTRGLSVSPHSELIDSPLAHGLLRKRLALGRSDVALSVFSAGVATGTVPRSPRLTDGALP